MNRATHEVLAPIEVASDVPEIGVASDLLTLTKARLSLLVVITTFVGFCMASGPRLEWLVLLHAIIGTTLAAAAAAVLNQVLESHVDRLMERTRDRPLPAGRIKSQVAGLLGVTLAVSGVAYLWLTTNVLSAALAAATIVVYLLFYTPLKRKTAFCTVVGAISGAIPPVIGWTAAQGQHPVLGPQAWVLFGILFTWQMPHFLAIAWIYRDEYAQAGFRMLKRNDVNGSATASTSFVFTLALSALTLLPFALAQNSSTYLGGALILDAALLVFAAHFLVARTRERARRLFFASILFLPLLLGLMVFTRA